MSAQRHLPQHASVQRYNVSDLKLCTACFSRTTANAGMLTSNRAVSQAHGIVAFRLHTGIELLIPSFYFCTRERPRKKMQEMSLRLLACRLMLSASIDGDSCKDLSHIIGDTDGKGNLPGGHHGRHSDQGHRGATLFFVMLVRGLLASALSHCSTGLHIPEKSMARGVFAYERLPPIL